MDKQEMFIKLVCWEVGLNKILTEIMEERKRLGKIVYGKNGKLETKLNEDVSDDALDKDIP